MSRVCMCIYLCVFIHTLLNENIDAHMYLYIHDVCSEKNRNLLFQEIPTHVHTHMVSTHASFMCAFHDNVLIRIIPTHAYIHTHPLPHTTHITHIPTHPHPHAPTQHT